MKVYQVSYDIRENADYNRQDKSILDYLKSYGENSFKLQKSSWLIYTRHSAEEIMNHIHDAFSSDSSIFSCHDEMIYLNLFISNLNGRDLAFSPAYGPSPNLTPNPLVNWMNERGFNF